MHSAMSFGAKLVHLQKLNAKLGFPLTFTSTGIYYWWYFKAKAKYFYWIILLKIVWFVVRSLYNKYLAYTRLICERVYYFIGLLSMQRTYFCFECVSTVSKVLPPNGSHIPAIKLGPSSLIYQLSWPEVDCSDKAHNRRGPSPFGSFHNCIRIFNVSNFWHRGQSLPNVFFFIFLTFQCCWLY